MKTEFIEIVKQASECEIYYTHNGEKISIPNKITILWPNNKKSKETIITKKENITIYSNLYKSKELTRYHYFIEKELNGLLVLIPIEQVKINQNELNKLI